SEAVEAARNIGHSRRLHHQLLIEPAAAECVAFVREQVIKEGHRMGAESAADTQEAVGTQPEVVGCEIVNRRINEKQLHGFDKRLSLCAPVRFRAVISQNRTGVDVRRVARMISSSIQWVIWSFDKCITYRTADIRRLTR